MMYIKEDIDLVATSSIRKVLVFNTVNINPKSTRDSQGVQVLTSKKGSKLVYIKTLEEMQLNNVDYYRTKNIPAIGCYLKDEDKTDTQLALELE